MNSSVKTIMFWLFILICLVMLWAVVERSAGVGKRAGALLLRALYDMVVSDNQVNDATIQGDELRGHLKVSPKDEFHTTLPTNYDDLLKAMIAAKVNFSIKEPQNNVWVPLLINAGPFVLLIAGVVLHAAPDAVGWQQGVVVRQEPRAPALDAAKEGHVQRRGRRG